MLSRVVTRLGSVAHINPKVIEGLYAADLAFLQEFYNQVNRPARRASRRRARNATTSSRWR